jgi:hypothetical protein
MDKNVSIALRKALPQELLLHIVESFMLRKYISYLYADLTEIVTSR